MFFLIASIRYSRCLAPTDHPHNASQGVREDTAELASWALSDVASARSGSPPIRHYGHTASSTTANILDSYFEGTPDQTHTTVFDASESSHPDAIQEVSEPVSPEIHPSYRQSPGVSALTEMLRNSPPTEDEGGDTDEGTAYDGVDVRAVTVGNGIISQPDERTPLLRIKSTLISHQALSAGRLRDLESGETVHRGAIGALRTAFLWPQDHGRDMIRRITSPKSWDLKAVWQEGVVHPASYLPAVVLGLLLNILDALSYGTFVSS